MQIDVIIQARTGSTRLPGKVLKNLHGKIMLSRVINRALKIKSAKRVIVATSENPRDQQIADFCKENNIALFRGSEDDILDRYVKTGEYFGSDVIIRSTGDNPFFDPEIAGQLIRKHLEEKNDYTFSVGFPLGTSCEIFLQQSLCKVNQISKNPIHHEHLGTYFLDKASKFKVGCLQAPKAFYFPILRLTVDTEADFETANNFLNNLEDDFSLQDLISLYKSQPQLQVNTHVKQVYPTASIKKAFSGNNPLERTRNDRAY